jgi:hypothetical protein
MRSVNLEQLTALKPDRAWVTGADQSIIVVSSPQVVGDTLVGYVNGKYEHLPSAGLTHVTVQASAPTRTALLAMGVAAMLGGVAIAVTAGDDVHPLHPTCSGSPTGLTCFPR